MGLLQGLGQAKPVSDFINTAGNYQANQSNMETQKLQRETLQAKAAQEKKDNAEYDVDAALSLYPEHVRPIFKKALVTNGRVQNNVVLGVDMRGIPDLVRKDPALALSINQADLEWNRKEAEKFAKKDDPESKEKALQYAREAANLQKLINKDLGDKEDKSYTLGEGQKRFDASNKEVAAGPPKETKGRMIPIFDPSSPTEYSYGDPATGEITDMAAPPPKSSAEKDNPFNSWKEAYIESKGRKPSPNEVMEWHRAVATNINTFDKKVVEGAIKTLPGLKEKAKSSNNGIARIDRMLDLISKGAGGRVGQAKAWLAPTLEAFGYKSQGLADAQMYETLAKTLGGSMRMEIVGPGVVSDYEQKLLAKVSAGGSTATDAAKELLTYYRGVAESNIKDYKDTVESVSGESSAATKVYRPIGKDKAPPAERKRLKYNTATGQLE